MTLQTANRAPIRSRRQNGIDGRAPPTSLAPIARFAGAFVTIAQLIVTVRDWQSGMSPEQARAATDELAGRTVLGFDGGLIIGTLSADALWGFAAGDKPAEQADADPIVFLRKPEPPPRKPKRRYSKAARMPAPPPVIDAVPLAPAAVASTPELPPKPAKRGRPRIAERARALVREQLKQGPKPESWILAAAESAEIPERSLIVAADALGVRTQRGHWWLPG